MGAFRLDLAARKFERLVMRITSRTTSVKQFESDDEVAVNAGGAITVCDSPVER